VPKWARVSVPAPKADEIVVIKDFFVAGFVLPVHPFIIGVMKKYRIYFHQLTPNAVVRLGLFIWIAQSQGVEPDVDCFCCLHKLHFQARPDPKSGLHQNFGCYNFVARGDALLPTKAYKSRWPSNWFRSWFYVKVDLEDEPEMKDLVLSPFVVSTGCTQPPFEMMEGASALLKAYTVVCQNIGTRDLVEE